MRVHVFDGKVQILHAGEWWTEKRLLCYHPCVIGRNARVSIMRNSKRLEAVMKSTWEEVLPDDASPPAERQVLQILKDKGVRGLPEVYSLECAAVNDEYGTEVITAGFPTNCGLALTAASDSRTKKKK